MDLKITVRDNFYKLTGALRKDNVLFFKERISEALNATQKIIINIDDVQAIDSHGVSALKELHYLAVDKSKELTIVGLGCKEIYDHFSSTEAA